MPGTMKTAAALAVIGLTWLPAYSQGDAAVCPKDPGPPLAAASKPVESPPAELPAPAPDLAIPPDADTVSTPGPLETRTVAVTQAPAPEALKRPITLDEALETAAVYTPAAGIGTACRRASTPAAEAVAAPSSAPEGA